MYRAIHRTAGRLTTIGLAALIAVGTATAASAHDPGEETGQALKGRAYDGHLDETSPGGVPYEAMSDLRCEDGMAGIFPCHKVDLASFLPLPDIEATFLNDVWGWEDPETGMQVAIAGSFEGTVFVDVTDGSNPVYLGTLPSAQPGVYGNIWGDIRVHENVAYIVSEARQGSGDDATGFGLQLFDLTQLRGADGPQELEVTRHITDFTNAHNVSLNTDTGRLYVVGATQNVSVCDNGGGGPIVYDVDTDPLDPKLLGCIAEDGYSHDIQCVTYTGPDTDHQGSEICLASNEDTLTIWDATEPGDAEMLGRLEYDGSAYTHQGWLSEDQSYFFLGDELDEYFDEVDERTTYIWDVRDLDDAQLIGVHSDGNESIDHNMFVHDGLLYQSNYSSGLWIYDGWKAEQGRLTDRGFFDVFPEDDRQDFFGTWGNYPYFGDGKVVVTSSDEGLFVLQSRARTADPRFATGNQAR